MRLTKVYEGNLDEILAIEQNQEPELVSAIANTELTANRLAIEMLVKRTDDLSKALDTLLGGKKN